MSRIMYIIQNQEYKQKKQRIWNNNILDNALVYIFYVFYYDFRPRILKFDVHCDKKYHLKIQQSLLLH